MYTISLTPREAARIPKRRVWGEMCADTAMPRKQLECGFLQTEQRPSAKSPKHPHKWWDQYDKDRDTLKLGSGRGADSSSLSCARSE